MLVCELPGILFTGRDGRCVWKVLVAGWGSLQSRLRQHLEGAGLSPASIRAYLSDTAQLVGRLSDEIADPDRLDNDTYLRACRSILNKKAGSNGGYSSSTLRRKASAFRCFSAFLVAEGLLGQPVRLDIVSNGSSKSQSENLLSLDEIHRVLEQPEVRSLIGARDAAALTLVVFCGLRSKEVVGLDLDDIQLDRERIIVRVSLSPRAVWLPPPAVKPLKHWLGLRTLFAHATRAAFVAVGKGDGIPVNSRRLGSRALRKALAKHITRALNGHPRATIADLHKSAAAQLVATGASDLDLVHQYAVSARTLRAYGRFTASAKLTQSA